MALDGNGGIRELDLDSIPVETGNLSNSSLEGITVDT